LVSKWRLLVFEVLLRFSYPILDDKHKWSDKHIIKVATGS